LVNEVVVFNAASAAGAERRVLDGKSEVAAG
jgi:hypothetical protein